MQFIDSWHQIQKLSENNFLMKNIHLWMVLFVKFSIIRLLCKSSCPMIPSHGPLIKHVKLQVAHAPGMQGTFPPSQRVSDPAMHHGTCVMHVSWCMAGSLASGFLWKRWQGKTFPAFPAHAQPTFYVSGKRPMGSCTALYSADAVLTGMGAWRKINHMYEFIFTIAWWIFIHQ